jgi:hypothetical protein
VVLVLSILANTIPLASPADFLEMWRDFNVLLKAKFLATNSHFVEDNFSIPEREYSNGVSYSYRPCKIS